MTGLTLWLTTASFVVGAIVGNLLFVQYLIRSAWRATLTGHVLLALFGVFALGYDITAVALLWPEWFPQDGVANWVRIGLRFAIDGALIGMYVLLVKAQRADRMLPPDPTIERLVPPDGARRPSTE